jgi:two-component system response regulator PfeR
MSCLGFDLTIRGEANKILLIEDDVALNEQLSELLSNAGYSLDRCFSGEEGLNLSSTQHYQLIVLGVILPKLDGFSLLSILRKTSQTPVIMLTAKGAEEERIRGFYYGADDCLTKPFSTTELLLRIKAMLKRSRGDIEVTNDSHLQLDSLYLDKTNQSVMLHGQLVELTSTEFRLLWVLLQHRGKVLKKTFLYQAVLNKILGRHDRSLDVHVSRVRKKLNAMGWQGERLLTVHGEGYRMS